MHGAPATSISWPVNQGNAWLDRSAPVRPASTSRDRGPVTARIPVRSVTSVTVTCSPSRTWEVSQSKSCDWAVMAELR